MGALGGARDNALYYANNSVGASAHFFVGFGGEICQSVLESDTAWHCGGGLQGTGGHAFFGMCTNSNSIGIELCVRKRSTSTMHASDTDWYFEPETLASAAELTRELMAKYGIPAERVIRHYDVTGKTCPAPFVHDDAQWAAFKKGLEETELTKEEVRYGSIGEIPAWGKQSVQKLTDAGALIGTGEGFDLSLDMLRIFVILDRMGKLD